MGEWMGGWPSSSPAPSLEKCLRGVYPPPPIPSPLKPGGFCPSQIYRAGRQKCHHLAQGEERALAEKIKGISDEMLICFWELVRVAATRVSGAL